MGRGETPRSVEGRERRLKFARERVNAQLLPVNFALLSIRIEMRSRNYLFSVS